jgi:magnesium chelatase family protein
MLPTPPRALRAARRKRSRGCADRGMRVLPAGSCCRYAPTLPAVKSARPFAVSPAPTACRLPRPGRGEGPGPGQARAGNRRGRRSQPAAQRPARHRQVDAGAAPARHAAADEQCGSAGRRRHAVAWRDTSGWAFRPARSARAASHRLGAGRWWAAARTPRPGRDLAGAPRRAVPRRTARIRARVLEALREPLETGHIHVARAAAAPSSRRASSSSRR